LGQSFSFLNLGELIILACGFNPFLLWQIKVQRCKSSVDNVGRSKASEGLGSHLLISCPPVAQ